MELSGTEPELKDIGNLKRVTKFGCSFDNVWTFPAASKHDLLYSNTFNN